MRLGVLLTIAGITAVYSLSVNTEKGYLSWPRMPELLGFESMAYKGVGESELKMHVLYPGRGARKRPCPAIVFFSGSGGRIDQFCEQARYFASRGMVTLLAEYRGTSFRHGTLAHSITDGKAAIRWIRAHAVELGVDSNRIVASGGSRGGYVAASAGILKGFEEEDKDSGISSVPNAMILFNPALAREVAGSEYRPIHHVRPGLPPAIVFHGTKDTTVSFGEIVEFCAAMSGKGNRCELVAFEGQGHGFFNFERGDGKAFYETLYSADKFLASLGYLEGEPTIEETDLLVEGN